MGRVSRRRPLVVLLPVAVVAAALATTGIWNSDASSRAPVASHAVVRATVTVGPGTFGRPVPSGFLGFSFEYWALRNYAGSDPNAIDPVLVDLMRSLTPGQGTVIRVGGVTTDRVWWPVAGVHQPPGAHYALTPAQFEVARALAQATGARLIMGIQFEANSRAEAAAESRAMLRLIGRARIEGLELGNEPELYSTRWFYKVHGRDVFGRPESWSFNSYLPDYERIVAAMGHVPLAGPATGVPSWMNRLPQFLAAEHVAVVTLHRYPLNACGPRRGASNFPTIQTMLATTSSVQLADTLARYVAIAHARRVRVRNAEMNSVSCGNAHGVANTFAGALWVLDALFNMARVGVDGVNIHTYSGAADELFSIRQAAGQWHAFVAPEDYGALMFAQAAPPRSKLLQVSAQGLPSSLRVWATKARRGRIHVVLINDSLTRPAIVSVRIPGARGAWPLERLIAPNVRALSGVTLGGRSYGTDTTTGLLRGRSQLSKIAQRGGAYTVRLAPASAAMLTIS